MTPESRERLSFRPSQLIQPCSASSPGIPIERLLQSLSFTPESTIRDPYVFEFLGLNARDVVNEGDLEKALLDRLQEFLLELGRGFCFEARQKRIVIGDENYFVDLVFYHRLLRCHVLIELKREKFKHEHLGQPHCPAWTPNSSSRAMNSSHRGKTSSSTSLLRRPRP